MRLHAVTLKDRGDALEVSVDFSYSGKLPGKKARRALAASALRRASAAVERGEEVDVGFAEDSKRRLRRDVYQVEKGG